MGFLDTITEFILLGDDTDKLRRIDIVEKDQIQHPKDLFQAKNDQEAIGKFLQTHSQSHVGIGRGTIPEVLPRALVKLIRRTTGLVRLVAPYFRELTSISTKQVIDELTENPDLRVAFGCIWTCFGTEPTRSPILFHGFPMSRFFDGAFYPRGEPDEILKWIIPAITAHGGKVLTNARVKHILLDLRGNSYEVSSLWMDTK